MEVSEAAYCNLKIIRMVEKRVQAVERQPTFRSNMSPPFSGLKSK
jgi:hypothetical protein